MKAKNIIKINKKKLQKWLLAIKIVPLVILVGVIKYFFNKYGLEIMDLNALFTSLVAATIFLIGFLISGVLSDYKESEKIPSELSASIRSLLDDTYTILKTKNIEIASQFIEFQKLFLNSLMDWFYKKENTKSIFKKISKMNDFFIEFDKEGIQSNYIIKMKNEQNNIRKMILRINTIRNTNFISSAYAILESMGFLIVLGLLIMKIDPFCESLFLSLLVTFLILYMILLIKDLDNPFDYSIKGETGTEIPLKPIHDLISEMKDFIQIKEKI